MILSTLVEGVLIFLVWHIINGHEEEVLRRHIHAPQLWIDPSSPDCISVQFSARANLHVRTRDMVRSWIQYRAPHKKGASTRPGFLSNN